MGEIRKFLLLIALLACCMAEFGCGGDEATGEQDAEAKEERLYPWLKGPSREFLIRDGDNVVQTFGREATEAEREQVSKMIQAWMRARAAQNWAKDCSYFSDEYIHILVDTDAVSVSEGKATTCPKALAFFGHQASGSYKNNMAGPVVSLRIGEGHGYAQYHGNDGHDWVVPVEKEDGKWWVANATPIGRSS
ncbi:MAG TPA: hypothetical protein VFX35_05845 [Solirubrobacterales bacterium]|nr:hypothetical protein [Solirubrobacterales bacterium]